MEDVWSPDIVLEALVFPDDEFYRRADVPRVAEDAECLIVFFPVLEVDVHRRQAVLDKDVVQQQSADAAVAILEWVDVLELVVDDSREHRSRVYALVLLVPRHELPQQWHDTIRGRSVVNHVSFDIRHCDFHSLFPELAGEGFRSLETDLVESPDQCDGDVLFRLAQELDSVDDVPCFGDVFAALVGNFARLDELLDFSLRHG